MPKIEPQPELGSETGAGEVSERPKWVKHDRSFFWFWAVFRQDRAQESTKNQRQHPQAQLAPAANQEHHGASTRSLQ